MTFLFKILYFFSPVKITAHGKKIIRYKKVFGKLLIISERYIYKEDRDREYKKSWGIM